jgi:hypothetical protein
MSNEEESTPPDLDALLRYVHPPKEPTLDDYDKVVAQALLHFQWLEEMMRHYLLFAELVIEAKVGAAFRYSPSTKEISNMPLGKLSSLFEKHCDNSALVQRIKAIIKPRNEVAHRSFLVRFDGNNQPVDRNALLREVLELEKIISVLPGEVALEAGKMMNACPEIFRRNTKP